MRPSRLRPLALAALAGALLAVPADASARSCSHANARPGDVGQWTMAKSTVCLLNNQRRRRGMRPLRRNRRLSSAARRHSHDMVSRHYFSHVSQAGRDVVDRLTNTGYLGGGGSWTVGENLAWGAGSRSTPREIVQAWMHSPGHRANILNRSFREIGIGVAFDTPEHGLTGATYTTTFGRRG